MNLIVSFFSLAVLLVVAGRLPASELVSAAPADVSIMQALAKQSNLAELPEWQKIVLYHRVLGRWVSRVDDPSYFLADDGKHDPQAELDATIRSAFDISPAKNSPQPQTCRYIARYQFLNREMKRLGFDYPAPKCDGFNQWRTSFSVSRVTLVFASVYLNSPASLYGHTFLRFDGPASQSRLNAMTVGYSVGGQSRGDPLFLARSLIGSYPGEFVAVPFYKKAREYSDLESRDLWEYELDLAEPEIKKMLAFIWEQSFTWVDYYFFDDNCALMLLAAIEAGRPNLSMLDSAKPWLVPLDAVKLVHSQPGLVSAVRYRPSQFNTAQFNYFLSNPAEQRDAVALLDPASSNGWQNPNPTATDRAHLLDLTLAMLEYQRNRMHSMQEAAGISAYQIRLSGERSKIAVANTLTDVPRPNLSPDQGHDSFRAGLGFGRINGHGYGRLNLRPSNHDALDPESGFATGARSVMGDLYLRFSREQMEFERLDILGVFAPSVRSAWFAQPSIKFNAAVKRDVLSDNNLASPQLEIGLGGGVSYRLSKEGRYFILVDSTLALGNHSTFDLGPTIGFIAPVSASLRIEADTSASWRALGQPHNAWLFRASLGLSYDLFNVQNNLRLHALRKTSENSDDRADSITDIRLTYSHYF